MNAWASTSNINGGGGGGENKVGVHKKKGQAHKAWRYSVWTKAIIILSTCYSKEKGMQPNNSSTTTTTNERVCVWTSSSRSSPSIPNGLEGVIDRHSSCPWLSVTEVPRAVLGWIMIDWLNWFSRFYFITRGVCSLSFWRSLCQKEWGLRTTIFFTNL